MSLQSTVVAGSQKDPGGGVLDSQVRLGIEGLLIRDSNEALYPLLLVRTPPRLTGKCSNMT